MKNWNNLSDDELDELFRQTANDSNIEFEEGAWNKMEGMLNKNQLLPSNSFWNRNALIGLALLFTIGSSLYLGGNYYFNKKSKNISSNNIEKEATKTTIGKNQNLLEESSKLANIEKKLSGNNKNLNSEILPSETKIIEKKNLNNSTSEINENGTLAENYNKPIDGKSKDLKSIVTQNINIKETALKGAKPNEFERNVIERSEEKSLKNKVKNAENKSFENTKNQSGEKVDIIEKTVDADFSNKLKKSNSKSDLISKTNLNKNTKILNKIGRGQSEVASNSSKKNTTSKSSSNKNNIILAEQNLVNKENNMSNSVLAKIESAPEAKSEIQQLIFRSVNSKQISYKKPQFNVIVKSLNMPFPESKPEPFFKKGFSVRVGLSPDISRVGSNAIQKIGSNMGGFLEYRFSKRLVLQAGIFRSMKYYEAYPEQYDWIWGKPASKLVDVEAACKMMDYPINIRYDIVANTKSRMFGTLGVTTYKMMNEYYDYNYENNADPNIKWHNWNGKTGSYFNSNLNISIGFEKQISKNLTMQIEPFVKAPLKSIGFGNVPLISYGMMFSANYPLNNLFKKK